MAGLPQHVRVVIVGAGIVGNCMAYHLARLGWRDILLIDKGPLPNPGGSTGHASNFIFLTDHSKEMTQFTLDSVRQYRELGVFTRSGGIEVARTAGAPPGASAAPRLVEVVGHRLGAHHTGRGQGARPVRRGLDHPRGLAHAQASGSSTRSERARSCARQLGTWAR